MMSFPSISLRSSSRAIINPVTPRNNHGVLQFPAGQADTSRFAPIPDELFLKIISHLPPKKILMLGLVNRKWYRISRDERLWKSIFHARFPVFASTESNTWFLDVVRVFNSKKRAKKLEGPRTINGCYGHEMLRIGNEVFMLRKNEDRKYILAGLTNLGDGTQRHSSYRESLHYITKGAVKDADLVDEGTHFYDPAVKCFYWAKTLKSKDSSKEAKSEACLSVHIFDMEKGALQKALEPCPQDNQLGNIARSLKVQEGFVVVKVEQGFRIWNTDGKYLGHIPEASTGNFWVRDRKLCIFGEGIIEWSLTTFERLESQGIATSRFNPEASPLYHQGVLNLYHCEQWEIYVNQVLAISSVFGKISARWNDDRFIVAANRQGDIVVYDWRQWKCHQIRSTHIINITHIERIFNHLFLLIDNTVTDTICQGHVQLWDLERNKCVKNFGTCQKQASRIFKHDVSFMIMPITSFNGREMVLSFWNKDRKEYFFKVFDFSRFFQ